MSLNIVLLSLSSDYEEWLQYYDKNTLVQAWLHLFNDLAEDDEDEEKNLGNPVKSIPISHLKKNIMEKTTQELEGEFGITRLQFKR